MARIAGIDLPKKKRGVIGLTYIFGIGRSTAKQLLNKNGIDENIKVQDWNDDQIGLIRESINEFKVEGQLRSEVQLNIKRLMFNWISERNCPSVLISPIDSRIKPI